MWAIVTWDKESGEDADVFRNEDGVPMVFGSCGEAVAFMCDEVNYDCLKFHPVLLLNWRTK